ncbi:MAG: MATE family efflux transporter [Lachnospiraceae bacterium]|nr:MATE family efflux transporter [Lachnospiraceae bacterium]
MDNVAEKKQIGTIFSGKALRKLIFPLVIEQTLAVTVGMADTMMIATRGENAVSGVSCVDTIVILLIGLFGAMATGGAVVCAQFLGHKDEKSACKAANQLYVAISILAIVLTVVSLLLNKQILTLIYKKLDPEVMAFARTYFYIVAASFPFLAVYNAGAALFRAMGNSKISMYVSFLMNVINIVGNAVFLFVFNMSVEGVALATLISRVVAAVLMTVLVGKKTNPIHIDSIFKLGFDFKMIKRILGIGIPNGLENSVFQLGKILVQGLTASFGTVAIAANAVANTVASFEVIPGSAMGLAMITVVGQCVGANDEKQMRYYTKKLMLISYAALIGLNILVLLGLDHIVKLYQLSDATASLAKQLMIIHSGFCMVIWPASFVLPNALRAANDVKFTMLASLFSMWTFRIFFSYILAGNLGMEVVGVWLAMIIDWGFRAIIFLIRFGRGGYRKHSFALKTPPGNA